MTSLTDRLKAKLAFEDTTSELKELSSEWANIQNQFTGRPPIDIYLRGKLQRQRKLQPLLTQLCSCVEALESGEPSYNSAWSMICLMAEGEGSNAEVYQTMAKAIHAKLKPALTALEESLK